MHFSRSPFIALAVSAMIGSVLELGIAADRAHRLVAVHLRHHDVHQHDVDVRACLRAARSPSLPVLGGRAPASRAARARWSSRRCCGCRRRRSAPCLPGEHASRSWSCSSDRAASARAARDSARWRNSAVSSSSRSGERTSLTMIVCASCVERRASSVGVEVARRVDDDRQAGAAPARARSARSSSTPRMSGSPRSSDHAVEARRCASALERLGAGADRGDLRRRRRRCSSTSASRCDVVVLDEQQALAGALDAAREISSSASSAPRVLDRLRSDAERAEREAALALVVGRR